jgi:predicted DCC family thiol-disulfide oxidoreductase YuxK
MPSELSPELPPNGWVLFDGSCGFCSWWIPFWAPLLRSHGYSIEELQAEWVQLRLGLHADNMLSDIRIFKPNGEQIKGANAYREVMSKVWWLWPIYFISRLPLFRQLFDLSYRIFNQNRYLVSRTCRLAPRRIK